MKEMKVMVTVKRDNNEQLDAVIEKLGCLGHLSNITVHMAPKETELERWAKSRGKDLKAVQWLIACAISEPSDMSHKDLAGIFHEGCPGINQLSWEELEAEYYDIPIADLDKMVPPSLS